MADIGPAVAAAGRTLAALLDGPVIQLVLRVEQIDLTQVGVEMSMASVAAGIYAVEEVDTPVN